MASLLFATGALWLVAHYLLAAPETGRHPAEHWALVSHGAAAMAALVLIGTLLLAHIVPGLRCRRRRKTGIAMLVLLATMILTSYGLYYLADEGVRNVVSVVHWAAGLAGFAATVMHARRRRNGTSDW